MTHIQKFILWSSVTLSIALMLVIGVYLFLQYSFVAQTNDSSSGVQTQKNIQSSTEIPDTSVPVDIEEDIPLKDLPISEQQLQTIESFGIDVDTFVITSAMITCAEEQLGAARVQEITAGASVDFIETIKLAPCLR